LPDEASYAGAVAVALIAVWILTPVARRSAVRTGFYDHPVGYKAHADPTPYLGGAAVLAGFLPAAILFADGLGHFAPILGGAVALGVVGLLDDRSGIRPSLRILAEAIAATGLWAFDLGWSFSESSLVELVLTVIWIVGFTNAFNLMDNMDGAASTVACICAGGVAAQAIVGGDAELAALAFALSGACLGFLRYNLPASGPARIFLGDGGSLPIGFIVAAAAMNIPVESGIGWPVVLVGALLLAIPVLDTLLVVVSRTRRRIALVTAGRDHLTHRLRTRLQTPRRVDAALAAAQAGASVAAILAAQSGRTTIIVVAFGFLALGAAAIALLERPSWAPKLQISAGGVGEVVELGVDDSQVRDVAQLRARGAGQRLRDEL
jgi:UDP-GlcNAc:undecaprenyl-phosphate/decaprenyl-phosphate GlcNAc-1-phosphate transferase